MIVALDAEALNVLVGPDSLQKRRVRQAMTAADRVGRDVVAPTLVLAELHRGPRRTRSVDALLARHRRAIGCRDTDPGLARIVGGVLHASSSGSEDLVDAHVVAVAVEAGGGVVLTGDAGDLELLAAPYRTIVVEGLGGSNG
jgi:predicted nucleic acid-binding protein